MNIPPYGTPFPLLILFVTCTFVSKQKMKELKKAIMKSQKIFVNKVSLFLLGFLYGRSIFTESWLIVRSIVKVKNSLKYFQYDYAEARCTSYFSFSGIVMVMTFYFVQDRWPLFNLTFPRFWKNFIRDTREYSRNSTKSIIKKLITMRKFYHEIFGVQRNRSLQFFNDFHRIFQLVDKQ